METLFNSSKMLKSIAKILILIFAFSFTYSCDSPTEPETEQNLTDQFQTLLNNTVNSDASIINAVLLVDAPQQDIYWKGASGKADPNSGIIMTSNSPFRIASLGKMTLSTLTMILLEENKFNLDDCISLYLPDSITDGLHTFQGQDYSSQITIRHLLTHTSGIADCFFDGTVGTDGFTDFLRILKNQPEKFWKPEETIQYTKENLTPFYIPGQGYHYSDVNYHLLGIILQNVSGKKLNILYKEKLFQPLGMNNTYFEYYDTPISGQQLSHQYFGEIDLTDWKSYSAEWAGGGLVSTAEDLDIFLRAFVNNIIFQNPLTKVQMMNWLNTNDTGQYYGLGILRINMSEFGHSEIGELYGHDGFTQSFMFYWPKKNFTIIGTLNQAITTQIHYQDIVLSVIQLLEGSN